MPTGDAVRRLSDELARDPGSLAFLPLAELLLGRGDVATAWTVARRGQARHGDRPDAHDLVARLAAARADWEEALAAWGLAAALAPAGSPLRAAAHQGMAYVCFRLERPAESEAHLQAAEAAGADAVAVAAARARLRSSRSDAAARVLFAPLLAAGDMAALLVDGAGHVQAGECRGADGRDASDAVAPALAGLAEAAERAMQHLSLGRWERITVEADGAHVCLAPATHETIVLVASTPATPLGRVRRLLEQVGERARRWQGGA